MASSTESDCHKDPNFAVICSFLDKYGESLGLPIVSYLDLESSLQGDTDNVCRVLIDIHVRLLRRIGKTSVTSDRFEKSIIKFCHHFSEFDAWEIESYGYKHANIKTKLRILKNLLECQFDYNLKFKEKVNESNAEEMRFLPIGRDKEGQAYWYFLDKDSNLLIYKEEQDDEDADTWQLVCSDRQQLANLVNKLKIGTVSEIKEEDDKTSMESSSSKEESPDKEITPKEEDKNPKCDDARLGVKQEPKSIVKEEPVERDKNGSCNDGVKTESNRGGAKQNERKESGALDKDKDRKLSSKVELNVSIKKLSEESVEKYKRRNSARKGSEGSKRVVQTSIEVGNEPEATNKEQTAEGESKEKRRNNEIMGTGLTAEGERTLRPEDSSSCHGVASGRPPEGKKETPAEEGSGDTKIVTKKTTKDVDELPSRLTASAVADANPAADIDAGHKDEGNELSAMATKEILASEKEEEDASVKETDSSACESQVSEKKEKDVCVEDQKKEEDTERQEDAGKKEKDAPKKDQEVQKKEGDAQKKEGDAQEKEGDAQKKEGDVQKKEVDAQKKEGGAQKKDTQEMVEDAHKKEEDIQKNVGDVQNKEDTQKKECDTQKKEDVGTMSVEAVKELSVDDTGKSDALTPLKSLASISTEDCGSVTSDASRCTKSTADPGVVSVKQEEKRSRPEEVQEARSGENMTPSKAKATDSKEEKIPASDKEDSKISVKKKSQDSTDSVSSPSVSGVEDATSEKGAEIGQASLQGGETVDSGVINAEEDSICPKKTEGKLTDGSDRKLIEEKEKTDGSDGKCFEEKEKTDGGDEKLIKEKTDGGDWKHIEEKEKTDGKHVEEKEKTDAKHIEEKEKTDGKHVEEKEKTDAKHIEEKEKTDGGKGKRVEEKEKTDGKHVEEKEKTDGKHVEEKEKVDGGNGKHVDEREKTDGGNEKHVKEKADGGDGKHVEEKEKTDGGDEKLIEEKERTDGGAEKQVEEKAEKDGGDEKHIEEKEKKAVAGPSSDSVSHENITDTEKEDNAESCPVPSELPKDPDRDKLTGTEITCTDVNNLKSDTSTDVQQDPKSDDICTDVSKDPTSVPEVSDVEEDFSETGGDYDDGDDFEMSKGTANDDKSIGKEDTGVDGAIVLVNSDAHSSCGESKSKPNRQHESKPTETDDSKDEESAASGNQNTLPPETPSSVQEKDTEATIPSSSLSSRAATEMSKEVVGEGGKDESKKGEGDARDPPANGIATTNGQTNGAEEKVTTSMEKDGGISTNENRASEKCDGVELKSSAAVDKKGEAVQEDCVNVEPKSKSNECHSEESHTDKGRCQTEDVKECPQSSKASVTESADGKLLPEAVRNREEQSGSSEVKTSESQEDEKQTVMSNGLEDLAKEKAVKEKDEYSSKVDDKSSKKSVDSKTSTSGKTEGEKASDEIVCDELSSRKADNNRNKKGISTSNVSDKFSKEKEGADDNIDVLSDKFEKASQDGEKTVELSGEKGDLAKSDAETAEDNELDEVDAGVSTVEKDERPRKRTRGSETQRNLKRAAPEPASDEVVECEPNGKRARPATRVQRTRGGRNAAATRLANKESESEDSESLSLAVLARNKRGRGRGRGSRGRGGRGGGHQVLASGEADADKVAHEENEDETSDQASGKRAKKKKPDSSSEALSEEEVTPAKKGRNQIQAKNSVRGAAVVARGGRRGGGRGGAKVAAGKNAGQVAATANDADGSSRRRSARVKEMKARRPPTPSSPEEESEPTEEDDEEDDEEEDFKPDKNYLEGSFTPEEESGDEEFKPKGRNFQRQAARTISEKNEEMINDDTPCVKCGKYNHPEMILLCDKCDAGYHTACLRPPLMVIPDGDWFCPPCEHSMLVERLLACLQSLDLALKKRDRLEKRQERLAYVGISINNILHGDRPIQLSEKFGHSDKEVAKEGDEKEEEEEEEEDQSQASSSYESEEELPEREYRSQRLALRQAEKRSRREKHKRRKPSRAQSPDLEVFAKRTCRTRNAVSYQFKEFDELISNAIDDDQPVRKEKPPGRSRGKDMSNILGASDEEDEKIRKRDNGEEEEDEPPPPSPPPPPPPLVVLTGSGKRKTKRKLTELDSDEDEEVEDESDEFKLSEDEDSDATEVEGEDGEAEEDEGLSEENSDSGDWKPKKTWYNSQNNRSSRRKKFVVEDDDEYDSDENASKRRSTRNSTRGRIKYDDWDSEEEETEQETEEEASMSDFSSDDSRFARKMKKEKEKRKQKVSGKGKKKQKKAGDDDEESEGSVSDSSMVRKRKMLMKLVKKRRKDESGTEESEGGKVQKRRVKSRKPKKKKEYSDDDTLTSEEDEDSDDEDWEEPRSKKKNVLRSSDEEEKSEKTANGETPTQPGKTEEGESNVATDDEPLKSPAMEEADLKPTGKRASPSKAMAGGKGKKRGEDLDLKNDWTNESKDEPVPGKVRRVSGSDKEGPAEPNPPLGTASPAKKVLPARRARATSKEGVEELAPEKRGAVAGNRRSSTDKQTRSGKKKKLPNFLDVPSGGESDEGEVKAQAVSATSAVGKMDPPVSSAPSMPLGAHTPGGPGFPLHLNQGPQPQGFPPNQHYGGHQFNPAFGHGQMGHPHLRPGLSSPPRTVSADDSTSMPQMPPNSNAPPGHPSNAGMSAATNVRGPYPPRYNGIPPHQMAQGMPPHMMNQALEPGQIPPAMNQAGHMRHPQAMHPQQPPPHNVGHDQPHHGMMQQQQWMDPRGPPGQPPSYGNAPRMAYPREMGPRQSYYHMRSPPPHGMGQYPAGMGPSMNNPLTSMGQMARNLSQGIKSPPPRPPNEAGEEGKMPSQDAPMKFEVKSEVTEKGREADAASPEKVPAKAGGKKSKISPPKSHPEKPEGEEMAANKQQAPPGGTSLPLSSSHPVSSAPPMAYQQHPYMNSQQGFYIHQHYRMPYGGPNQAPMNPMRGMPPSHQGQYMNPNHPYPMPQGHRPYLPPPPAGQPQAGGLPPNAAPANPTGVQNPPPHTMPNQQGQPGIMPPSQQMSSGMPAQNPGHPTNQQRPPPSSQMNQGQQHVPSGPPDGAMMPQGSYQRPPGVVPYQGGPGVPGMMPGHPGQPSMAHQTGGPPGPPSGQVGPHDGPQYPPHAQQGVQSGPVPQPTSQRMPPPNQQAKLTQPPAGMAQIQPGPMNASMHPQAGSRPNLPASGQGEPVSSQGASAPGSSQRPSYYQMQTAAQMGQAGGPTPPDSGSHPAQGANSHRAEGQRSVSPTEMKKAPETDAAVPPERRQKTISETIVKEEPTTPSKQEGQQKPAPQGQPQGEANPPSQGGVGSVPSNAGQAMPPATHSNEPTAVSNPNNRNFPPPQGSMAHMHAAGQAGQGPPMPYYGQGPYYQPYGQHMHPQGQWGQNMPPSFGPRFGGHMYPPYGMGPEAMGRTNAGMPPQGQGMLHGHAGVPVHPQSTPGATGPMNSPPHTAVPSTSPHATAPQDFQSPRDQLAAVQNRRSSSSDSRSNVSPAAGYAHPEVPPESTTSNANSHPPPSAPTVSSPSVSIKSEHIPAVTSPSVPSSSSTSSSSLSTTTTTVSTPSVSQAPVPGSPPKSMPSNPATSENQDFKPHNAWSSPMNRHYSSSMGQMPPRMGAPGPYNVMPPYGGQGMMGPNPHFYMMGPNPRQPNSTGNFEQYQGHMPPMAHGMPPHQPVSNQPPMNYNGGYRPQYNMPPGHQQPGMPPSRSDFNNPEMYPRPNAPPDMRHNSESASLSQVPPSDSQTNEGSVVAPKAKRAKTQKKKDVNVASSPRGKGSRGRGRGRGGFTIDSLLEARGTGREEEEGEESGEMKDIVNYVTTDEYIKQQTSS